jgi:undecaprenyl pyrophosphate phosphatase UppP
MEKRTENSLILPSRQRRDFFLGMLLALSPVALFLPFRQLLDETPTTWYGAVSFGFSFLSAVSELFGLRVLLRYITRNESTSFMKVCAMLACILALFSLAAYLWGILLNL